MLTTRSLSKTYADGTQALSGIDLDVPQAEIVALIGGSGCGKTTLLRLIAGLDTPSAGAIELDGDRIAGPHPGVGLVFQEPRLLPWLDVADNVGFGLAHLPRAERKARVAHALERVGLSEHARRWPRELSGGQQQRVSIARAFVASPRVLLLDEPFSALDAFTRKDLHRHLLALWEEVRPTVLIVTHDVAEAVALADRAVVMRPEPGRLDDTVALGHPRPRDPTAPASEAASRAILAALDRSLRPVSTTRKTAEPMVAGGSFCAKATRLSGHAPPSSVRPASQATSTGAESVVTAGRFRFRSFRAIFNPEATRFAGVRVKSMFYSDLRNEQVRQIIDVEQVFAAYRIDREQLEARFAGSMSWKTIAGRAYLYRKVASSNRSLGARSPETEQAYERFQNGRARQRDRVKSLAHRLDEMAPVNRALGIGRMPVVSARVVRRLDPAGLLGKTITIVGTNALYAYERMAGVQVASGLLATGDVDLLLDARTRLKLASQDVASNGLLGLLRQVDASFSLLSRKSFRAVNRHGFMVDLIKATPRDVFSTEDRTSLGGDEDLHAIGIEVLAWLVNSRKHQAVVIDDRGFPLTLSVPDPRAFALHKAWLADRADRDPAKRQRDIGQARVVAAMVTHRLPHLRFDADDLSALPSAMRRIAARLLPEARDADDDRADLEPRW